jgi:hypothetical protein
MKQIWNVLTGCLAAGSVITAARADLATSPAGLGSSGILVGFDSPRGAGLVAPLEWSLVSGISIQYSTLGGPGSLGTAPQGTWSLGMNGDWAGTKTFAGVDGGASPDGVSASMMFEFKGSPVMAVGGVLNYVPDLLHPAGSPYPLYLAAYGVSGNLLEAHELPLFTPGAFNAGVFYGIERDLPEIARLEIAGPFAVVDDLVVVVPEPGVGVLLAVGTLAVSLGRVGRRGRPSSRA